MNKDREMRVKRAYKKVPGIVQHRAMASANKRSCHRIFRSAMFPVTEPIPNTTSTGLPALGRISARIIVPSLEETVNPEFISRAIAYCFFMKK